MTFVHLYICQDIRQMESLTLTSGWRQQFLWIPILWSHPTWLILWDPTIRSRLSPPWFACLQILLLHQLAQFHPRFTVVGSFVLAPYPTGMGVQEEDDVGIIPLVDLGMDTIRSMVVLDGTCWADREDSPFYWLWGYHFSTWHTWVVEIQMYSLFLIISFMMYLVRYFVGPIVDIRLMTYHVWLISLLLLISNYDGCGMILHLS